MRNQMLVTVRPLIFIFLSSQTSQRRHLETFMNILIFNTTASKGVGQACLFIAWSSTSKGKELLMLPFDFSSRCIEYYHSEKSRTVKLLPCSSPLRKNGKVTKILAFLVQYKILRDFVTVLLAPHKLYIQHVKE